MPRTLLLPALLALGLAACGSASVTDESYSDDDEYSSQAYSSVDADLGTQPGSVLEDASSSSFTGSSLDGEADNGLTEYPGP